MVVSVRECNCLILTVVVVLQGALPVGAFHQKPFSAKPCRVSCAARKNCWSKVGAPNTSLVSSVSVNLQVLTGTAAHTSQSVLLCLETHLTFFWLQLLCSSLQVAFRHHSMKLVWRALGSQVDAQE